MLNTPVSSTSWAVFSALMGSAAGRVQGQVHCAEWFSSAQVMLMFLIWSCWSTRSMIHRPVWLSALLLITSWTLSCVQPPLHLGYVLSSCHCVLQGQAYHPVLCFWDPSHLSRTDMYNAIFMMYVSFKKQGPWLLKGQKPLLKLKGVAFLCSDIAHQMPSWQGILSALPMPGLWCLLENAILVFTVLWKLCSESHCGPPTLTWLLYLYSNRELTSWCWVPATPGTGCYFSHLADNHYLKKKKKKESHLLWPQITIYCSMCIVPT